MLLPPRSVAVQAPALPSSTRRPWTTAALLLALSAVLYRPALRHWFIADDLVNLDFVRRHEGSWLKYLSPLAAYSDPVTRSRYKPLYVYYFRAADLAFGDRPWAWHALSLLWHVAAAMCVYALARRLFRDPLAPVLAALLFASTRLHSQMVVWVSANYRLLSAVLTLGAVLSLDARSSAWAVGACALLFTLSIGMNPESVVLLPILGAILWLHRRDPSRARTSLSALAACAPVALAFVAANRVSQRRFPDLPIALTPDPSRVLLFFANLAVPFAVPLSVKVLGACAVVAAALSLRDRRVRAMLLCALACALFYAVLEYPLAPRYLYLASAFWSVVLARLIARAARRTSSRPALAAAALATPLVLASAWALRETDLEDLGYLACVGERLTPVQREARARGRRLAVHIQPVSSLDARNLAFFRDELRFVPTCAQADRVVDSGYARCRARFGPGFDEDYWYLPWFQWRMRW